MTEKEFYKKIVKACIKKFVDDPEVQIKNIDKVVINFVMKLIIAQFSKYKDDENFIKTVIQDFEKENKKNG